MKTMYETPADFLAEVNRLSATKIDHVASTDKVSVHTDERTILSIEGVDNSYPVNEVAHSQIATRLGIPQPYYRRMRASQPALLDANIATWMNDPVERRLFRTLEGNLRAFLSDRYQRIDNLDILKAINEPLQRLEAEHGVQIVSTGLTDTHMYVKVTVPGVQAEIRTGDIVQAGFVIRNSETGHGSFSVEQMLYRLVCLNGMTVGEKMSRRHVGARIGSEDVFSDRTRRLDDRVVVSAARDLIEAAVDETRFQALVARLRETTTTSPSRNPVQTVETLAQQHALSESEQGLVLSMFVTDANANGLGLYGVVNAVTRASQEVEDYERASELERLGGVLLDTSTSEWMTLAGV